MEIQKQAAGLDVAMFGFLETHVEPTFVWEENPYTCYSVHVNPADVLHDRGSGPQETQVEGR
jgi:hypothetical protein